ncbi:hypothetical protein H072_9054 [Dactylellina haptotyla CBS 200.50]|uniref:Clr5 domain-containing protein n=1 Tax=Dactylellina haptotyla (strain CBS 200.50) TaxID=1284197 RepID=S8BDM3_DACHA|nr:hypothetical protein H072_9054 [Dactylellina haptotyla CBS 200.50]
MSQPFLKPATQKLDQTEWEAHKDRIVDLWLHNDLMIVMQTMADEVGFIATKSQYTKQLNSKWNVKKYFTDQELDHIEDRIKERELEGKVTRVKRYGQKISKENLKRRKARRFVKTIDKFQKIAPKPVQSEHIVDLNIDIGTPTTLGSTMTPRSIHAELSSASPDRNDDETPGEMLIDPPISSSIGGVPEHTLNRQPWRSREVNEVSVIKGITWEAHVRQLLDYQKQQIMLYPRY